MLSAAFALALVGCGPPPDFGPVAVYDPHGPHYETTDLAGTVHISEGCVTVRWQGNDVVLLFPSKEVKWDPDAAQFTYGGQAYGDGDSIRLKAIVHFGRETGDVPEACPLVEHVFVLRAGVK